MIIRPVQIARATLPRPLFRRVLEWRRRSLYSAFEDAGLVFIHVPRCAGTSISRAIYPVWVDHFTLADQLRDLPDPLLRLPRFAVLRNPWDRLVSAWSFARAGTGLDGSVDVRQPSTYRSADFTDFTRFVREWLPGQDYAGLDPIFRCQADFVTDGTGAAKLDHLGRVERLDETADWIGEVTGTRPTIGRRNASDHGDYRGYYDAALRDAVGAFYARDIALFRFEF